MSTAGKVLTVLILLASAGWVFLMAQVAEITRNQGKREVALEAQIDQAQADASKAVADVAALKRQIENAQVESANVQTTLRSEISNIRKFEAFTVETLDRYNNRLATLQIEIDLAEKRQRDRAAEEVATKKLRTETRARMETLIEGNDKLLDRLASLRSELEQTMEANRAIVERARGSSPSNRQAPAARTRAASLSQ